MSDCKLPRVSEICKEMILFDSDDRFLLKKYLRRGRLVNMQADIVARGGTPDPEWLKGHSGEAEDDRVEHAEVLPYIEGLRQCLREHDIVVKYTQLEVINKALGYIGHLDWIILRVEGIEELWDLKCGKPPSQWVKLEGLLCPLLRPNPLYVYYRRQTALYAMAYGKPYMRRAGLHLYKGTYQLVRHDDRSDIAKSTAMVAAYYERLSFKRQA